MSCLGTWVCSSACGTENRRMDHFFCCLLPLYYSHVTKNMLPLIQDVVSDLKVSFRGFGWSSLKKLWDSLFLILGDGLHVHLYLLLRCLKLLLFIFFFWCVSGARLRITNKICRSATSYETKEGPLSSEWDLCKSINLTCVIATFLFQLTSLL